MIDSKCGNDVNIDNETLILKFRALCCTEKLISLSVHAQLYLSIG